MIYYNYPPYYYPAPIIANKKTSTNLGAHSNIHNSYTNKQQKTIQDSTRKNQNKSNFTNQQATEKFEKTSLKQKEIHNKSNNNTVFEIFGIKLYFDDILLICLIFFLYNEGVKDQYLFIALVLLLLS